MSKQTSEKFTVPIVYWLLFGVIVFFLWASLFQIDQAVRVYGSFIPSAQTQSVQVVDGGVLESLLVVEGQKVEGGETLAVLERERALANYQQSLVQVAAQSAGLARAKAEIAGKEPVFDGEALSFPELVDVQRSYFDQRRRTMTDGIAVIEERLSVATQELAVREGLAANGDTSLMEVLKSQKEVAQLKGERVKVSNDYFQTANEEATRLYSELATTRHQLQEKKSILDHTVLVSPATGIVKSLNLNTLGAVLRTGDELMQISPTEDDLAIEVKIEPIDIGSLTLGQPVSIYLDSFDYSIFGTLEGTLTYLSSDTLSEDRSGQSISYYLGRISLNSNAREVNPRFSEEIIKPGMTVSASIRTGQRTVLHYLFKPILRGFSGALTER